MRLSMDRYSAARAHRQAQLQLQRPAASIHFEGSRTFEIAGGRSMCDFSQDPALDRFKMNGVKNGRNSRSFNVALGVHYYR